MWHIIQTHQIIWGVGIIWQTLLNHFSIQNHIPIFFFIQTDKQYVVHLYNLKDTLNLLY